MMNHKISIIICIGLLFALPSLARSQSPEASESAPLETIKENVKKRIQEVVEKKSDSFTETAYVGTLISRTTTSLTLETKNGSQLASGSAQVVVENVSNKAKSSFEDLEIGDYMSIIGTLDSQDVLVASKVLLSTEPKPPINKHVYGVITSINTQEDTLTIASLPSNEEKIFELNSKSLIEQATATESKELDLDASQVGLPIVVMYQPGTTPTDTPTLLHATIKVTEFLESSITTTPAKTSPTPKVSQSTAKPSPTAAKVTPTKAKTPTPSPKTAQ